MAEIAKIVQGNNFNVAIPLKVYTLNEGEVVLQDYTPAEGDDVTIRLVGERRGYTYKPTTEGNVAHLQLSGHEVCDTYAVEVVIIGADGTMLRSYRNDQLAIVYNVDTIIADGAVEEGELYLDSQFFIQGQKGEQGDPGQDGTDGQDGQDGADGRGIVSITKTATQGLVDTYTITYTDGTTSTFEVTNGKDGSGGGGEDFIVNVTYSGGAYTADKTPEECCQAFLDGKRVVFANTASTPLYGDSRTFIATSVSVYNQYNQWNIYAVSGNGRGDAKVDILCYEKQYTASLTFKSITATTIIDNLTSTSTTAALSANQGRVLKGLVDGKQDTLVSGTTIKTINSQSVLGSGDIAVATPTDLATYCPIIEDRRQSAVAAITGVAPFASLVDGQRIVLRLAYATAAGTTLNLTLSNDTTTGAKGVYAQNATNFSQLAANYGFAHGLMELLYESANNRWVVVGWRDTNTTYNTMTQAEINAGTQAGLRVISPKLLCDNFDKVTTLVEVTATGDVKQALVSGKFYRFGEVDSLTLTFTAPSAGMGMWGGKFTASASWSALGIPATIDEAAGNDTIAGGKTYEFNVLDGIIVIKEV